MYLKIENLLDRKSHYETELEDAKENIQEVDGEPDLLRGLDFLHGSAI
jgi:hypothetical protein